ncbi:unnamed protein product (macronuclear) [Paramecium tetraurelia]|uniref:Uncharacterized protein n=1 Tax=Paramecium tetraurelia TaxID=5888 RepID=A0EFZ1_PARTE|nr:uncharacterized protein GSPATT00026555001 [Paramecium tetraurelia]CAK94232.1 unnamed protein product [Paramecium tetraurelia]|eukprot:XP_001461605.1 hypothetical protein (macronuclear) [Paramecium tetraurelia strain d4-2]
MGAEDIVDLLTLIRLILKGKLLSIKTPFQEMKRTGRVAMWHTGLLQVILQGLTLREVNKILLEDEILYEKGMTCQNIYIVLKRFCDDEVGSHIMKRDWVLCFSYANLLGDGKCK